jgi:hypothetical protein
MTRTNHILHAIRELADVIHGSNGADQLALEQTVEALNAACDAESSLAAIRSRLAKRLTGFVKEGA